MNLGENFATRFHNYRVGRLTIQIQMTAPHFVSIYF